jgi:hypothetical protein
VVGNTDPRTTSRAASTIGCQSMRRAALDDGVPAPRRATGAAYREPGFLLEQLHAVAHFLELGGGAVEPLVDLLEPLDAGVQPVQVGADDATHHFGERHFGPSIHAGNPAESGGRR